MATGIGIRIVTPTQFRNKISEILEKVKTERVFINSKYGLIELTPRSYTDELGIYLSNDAVSERIDISIRQAKEGKVTELTTDEFEKDLGQ